MTIPISNHPQCRDRRTTLFKTRAVPTQRTLLSHWRGRVAIRRGFEQTNPSFAADRAPQAFGRLVRMGLVKHRRQGPSHRDARATARGLTAVSSRHELYGVFRRERLDRLEKPFSQSH